jgi:hypothetical protein
VGVEYYWRRARPASVAGLRGEGLGALVPRPEDHDYPALRDVEWLVGTRIGGLVLTLLAAGAESEAQMAAVDVFGAQTRDWDDDFLVGTLPPADVRVVAEFLAGVPVQEWLDAKFDVLELEAEQLGWIYDDRASIILRETVEDLTALFRGAAEEGDAVIVKVTAG